MHAINQMKYPHVLLCGTVISLLTASCAYAVESLVTPGPSVGHRPITINLGIGTGTGASPGDMTQPGGTLIAGQTLGLFSAAGNDPDGDPDKGGANCVWYRVDPNTQAETVAKDPGAADRNCHYTLQAADVGFKIKNVIKIFSDQDIATAKGFTINPIDSWPVETVSANRVAAANPYISRIETPSIPPLHHKADAGFPKIAYQMAYFDIIIEDGSGSGNLARDYRWSSSEPYAISVSSDGSVTVNNVSVNPVITITATPKSGGGKALTYEIKPREFVQAYGNLVNHANAAKYCVPPRKTLTPGDYVNIWKEWGDNGEDKSWSLGSTNGTYMAFDWTTGKEVESKTGSELYNAICIESY
ncbi:MAG: hypothetical protein RSC83_13385 [Hafnia sp.]